MDADQETPKSEKCPDCNGEGWSWQRMGGKNVRAECLKCEGEGDVRYRTDNNDGDSKGSAPPEIRSGSWVEREALYERILRARREVRGYVCPKCGSTNVTIGAHHESFAFGECYFNRCDECAHQWDHA